MTEPRIRFQKEDGVVYPEWGLTTIGDIVDRQESPVKVEKESEYREIGIRSHGKGIFHKDPVTGKELGNKRVFNIVPGCLVLNIVFAWERAVAKTTADEVGMIASHRFPMYKPKDGILDLDYIVRYLISDKGKKILELASPGGAGRNRTLGQKAFIESELPLPCYEEQKKIAEFFDKIDDVISNVEKELEAYIRLKAGMLQKMFPRNGSRVPEVRFPGFTEDWEQRKLGDIVSLRGRIGFRGYKETDLVPKGQGAITFSPSDIDEMGKVSNENNKYLSWEKYDESPEIQVQVGDILFTKTASIGKVGYVRELKEKATINPQFALLTPNETTNGYFTFLSVRNDDFMKQVRGITGGSSVPTMSQEKLKELVFMSPEIKEQEQIGSFFESIDNLITLQQRELDIWNKMKTGYLQRMFI